MLIITLLRVCGVEHEASFNKVEKEHKLVM